MKTSLAADRRFEFCEPRLDLLIEVEEAEDGVVIRATRDVLTEAQKVAFVRHLAAEGFIAENHRWCESVGRSAEAPVRWIIDYRWLEPTPELLAVSRRFMTRLFIGAGALWVVLMWTFVVRGAA